MDKEFFQRSWGEDGYYEQFSYGVGIKKVCSIALFPFLGKNKIALELGPGGGVFTENMIDNLRHLIAIDVIKMPYKFNKYQHFTYIELSDNTYRCAGVEDNSIDFCFSYNVFCHLSNDQLKQYVKDVNRVLKRESDFVFMLSNFKNVKQEGKYELGDLLPMGHFYQDERTVDIIADKDWEKVSSNMIPEHRDIIVHLKKK